MNQLRPALDPSASSAPIQRCGRGWAKRAGGLHVVKVAGSAYEMGYQHGVLLKDEIRRGPIPYFRTVVEKLVGEGAIGPAGKMVWPTLQRTIGRRVARSLPPHVADTVRGVADGAGLDPQVFLDGCTMPDALMWVAARLMKMRGHGPAVAHRLALELEMGCTSAIAWGGATSDGAMLHARNFDYHGVGCWPATQTVLFHEPDDAQRYVSITAAGVALGGVTAMNESGLTLTVHQHMFTDRTRLGGAPIGVVGDMVMRDATTLDEARDILAANPPIGCWTYVMTDGKTKEAMLWEENPERNAEHRFDADDGTVGYANIYLDEALGDTEVSLYGSYWRHNLGRHQRVHALLEERKGELDPQGMASILGDTGAGECRIKDSIAMAMTVGSVVFRPEDGTVWVGTGEAPTSRGTFEAFSLATEDHAPDKGTLRVGALEDEADRDAFENFRRAYLAYVDDCDAPTARGLLRDAFALAPDQPLYSSLAGILSMTLADAEAAERELSAAIALGHEDPERVASFHLWRGRARDILGRRSEALRDYRLALARPADAPVHRAAQRGLKKVYTARQARRVHADMGLADVVAP